MSFTGDIGRFLIDANFGGLGNSGMIGQIDWGQADLDLNVFKGLINGGQSLEEAILGAVKSTNVPFNAQIFGHLPSAETGGFLQVGDFLPVSAGDAANFLKQLASLHPVAPNGLAEQKNVGLQTWSISAPAVDAVRRILGPNFPLDPKTLTVSDMTALWPGSQDYGTSNINNATGEAFAFVNPQQIQVLAAMLNIPYSTASAAVEAQESVGKQGSGPKFSAFLGRVPTSAEVELLGDAASLQVTERFYTMSIRNAFLGSFPPGSPNEPNYSGISLSTQTALGNVLKSAGLGTSSDVEADGLKLMQDYGAFLANTNGGQFSTSLINESSLRTFLEQAYPGKGDALLQKIRAEMPKQFLNDSRAIMGNQGSSGAGTKFLENSMTDSLSGQLGFDEGAYLATYLDVADAVRSGAIKDGFTHFVTSGFLEGRLANPSAISGPSAATPTTPEGFDELAYLALNPDVAAAVQNGVFGSGAAHFDLFGQSEGRSGSFPEESYLSRYPDVQQAVAAGLVPSGREHFLNAGRYEGRQLG